MNDEVGWERNIMITANLEIKIGGNATISIINDINIVNKAG